LALNAVKNKVYLRVVVGTMGGLQPKIIEHSNLLLQISKGVMA